MKIDMNATLYALLNLEKREKKVFGANVFGFSP